MLPRLTMLPVRHMLADFRGSPYILAPDDGSTSFLTDRTTCNVMWETANMSLPTHISSSSQGILMGA